MKEMKTLLAVAAGALLIGSVAEAQTQVQPTRPGGPQVQPPRPQPPSPVIQPPRPQPPRPVIQPPRPPHPVQPIIVQPRPPRPVIQPPRPPHPVQPIIVQPRPPRPVIQPPRPPHPIRPRPPIIVIPVWNYHNPGWAYGRAVLYSGAHYSGNYLTVRHNIPDLRQYGFNDRADSLHARGRWQICSKTRYRGRCATVRGSDPYLGRLTGEVSSIRYLGH